MNTLHIFDSVKKEKVEFKPIQERKVKIYVCGPTVYDDSHLGHARSAIAFDLLHRVLKANDYEVTMTKNFTDIDDKIIKKMYETKKTLEEITATYIKAYKNDMKALNILDNTIEPKATENLEVMKEMISNLISKDVAYKTSDSVYFDTSKDNLYGTLSHKSNDENSQARVEENQEKRNSADFALWKFEKANDVSFDAPFGKGRPGWHIECSAMIEKHLAYKDSPYQIDIHAGGADLLFPHHENEAAQTRCSSGQNLAKYWMHNGFVNINGEKMSKSLGNSFFLKDVLKSYSGEVIRFYLMSTHYRADLSFNEEDLIASKKRLDKIYRLKKRVYGVEDSSVNKKFKEDILNALNDDINTSIALSVIDEMVNSANDKLDSNPKDKNLKKELISNINFIEEVLGIGGNDAYAYFQFGIDESTKEKIEDLILKRNEAKKTKDFETADKLRDELSSMDISLMDTVNGTVWEKL
ncbi:cysteine--tRNA ligase [Aliarcobacter butzleri]|uniref:Cysteine--tRNA ligase n=1 Tax=Aliarcobacter butzleri TaxID=28197 RepID=A0AAP4UZ47_9BACT|nr:cysteine--tRNA ligase [Aliarcobacter butzleri]MDN5052631.1 cysteine--tRNA ligase [Aliarcobacter butzleri]MDN5074158.1 cysteine--tRNA ligase [Aliarcobacter butzleri]MDN5116999.1 cysteine--tRNA ligase [Aliarcobacter butzleri]MDN5132949.1 cysteine--tRNA ligase [Aliarcobacter butzleri]NUW25583.1 cysteine--tRNA ligase [Aliarcobacter butzleri]